MGISGIAVIRMSGPRALPIASDRFLGKSPLVAAATQTAHVGNITTVDGEPLDQVVCTVFRSPHSYTGEDCVEISCHGGMLVSREILGALIASGARAADAGEFTKRAFLNGRLDLAQAEAVAELIHSSSEVARRSSFLQLQGKLSEVVAGLRKKLVDCTALLELELDFAEEGLVLVGGGEAEKLLRGAIKDVSSLMDTFGFGRMCRDGVKVVLAGAPNVGKSSLFNALLEEERAIVTEIPGTTRDVIEGGFLREGILFRLVDTAGIRDSDDKVEKEGVRRAALEAAGADIILFVVDNTRGITKEDEAVARRVAEITAKGATKRLVLVNKSDLAGGIEIEASSASRILGIDEMARVSAVTKFGLHELCARLVEVALAEGKTSPEAGVIVTSARHHDALRRAKGSLETGLSSLEKGYSHEFVTPDLRRGIRDLGEIIGEIPSEEILNTIFGQFCIGK